MAEVLVVGKKISEMDLVTDIVGDEKIPTGVVGDKAVTTGQLLTYLENNGKVQWGRIEGDIANQDDLQNQFTQQLATLQNHIQDQGNPHNVTKEQVGLSLVDNTADMDKPVSTAVQEALSLKADQTYVEDSLANKTHNSLLGRDADGAHPAGSILDGSGVTQQQVNDLTGAPYRSKEGGYNVGERVVLENGDIVRSTAANNTVDPNVDMTGWENFEADQKEVTQGIPAELATYAALRNYTGAKMIAIVGGRSNYFDGGFGRFAVKASDTTSADNDGTILVDAKGRRWHRIIQTEYGNPEWFGMSESVADNTPLVEKCLNIVGSAFIRKGDFPIQNTLRVLSGQTLIGLNDKSSFVMNNATKGVIITHDGTVNKTQPNVTIKGIRAKGTALYGFGLTHCTQSNFEHLSVDGITATYGFIYEGFWNTHIKDHKTNGAIITNTCFAVNKIVLNTEFDALYSSNAAPYNIKIDSTLALISNNTWAGFGDLVFTGAAFQGATKYALSIVAGTGITFNTAYMENCLGALHIGYAQDVVFNLCGFVGLKSGQSTHSMWLGSNSSNTMSGITFNQCKFPLATYPVVIDYAGAGITFNQPRCVDNIALSSMIQRTSKTLGNMPVSIYRDADSTGATADVKKTNNGAWKLERTTYNDTGVATRTIITPPETTATMIPL